MTTTERPQPKRRRARKSGSVYRLGRFWYISYHRGGKRMKESSVSPRKGDAERLLAKRTGAVLHHLPVVKNEENLTFDDAAQAVVTDTTVNHPASLKGLRIKITKHLTPFFGGWRMALIGSADVVAFIVHRQQQGIIARNGPHRRFA